MQRMKSGEKVTIAVMSAIIGRKPKKILRQLIFDNVTHLSHCHFHLAAR